jgi:hypothetical protein
MKIMRVLADEPLEQRGDDVERADAVYEMRIEILDLFAVSLVKNLEPVPFLDCGLNRSAGRQRKKENEEEPRIDTDFHGCAEDFLIRV